jgi:uncharacterized Zn finger protein
MAFWEWPRYVPVAERRARAQREMDKLRKKGQDIQPVTIDGRTIARSFWGKGWCDQLESFSDYVNRLPRGRTYVRNGSVCHLDIRPGHIAAIVSGSELYRVAVRITELKAATWTAIKAKCAGHIGSMLELLQGKLSDQVMAIVTHRQQGLFPQPGEMTLNCSCPDGATMCKHVAAVIYGVGSRLDTRPELLFLLRGVDAQELITAEMALPDTVPAAAGDTLADDQLSAIFGIDLDTETDASSIPPAPAPKPPRATRRVAATHTPQPARATPARQATPAAMRSSARAAISTPPKMRPTGKSVARLRRQQGLSVAEFATQLGVSSTTVYRWEATQGPLNLQARLLNALAALQQRVKKNSTDAPPGRTLKRTRRV